MIIQKVHQNNMGDIIIALCDKSILGKTFDEGDVFIDASSDFYNGEELNENKFNVAVSKANSINAVGDECIGFLIKKKLLTNEFVKTICKVKYAFILLK